MTRLIRCLPLGALALSGCLASKGDVLLLQGQLQSMQSAAARVDTARAAQIDRVLTRVQLTNDSVRGLSERLAKLQSTMSTDHYEMGRQILQIQELSGQSQRRLQELRASLEERSQSQTTVPPATPGATPEPAGPGPAQLFQSSLDQLRRGSTSVARSGFEELLRSYPQSEDAPEATVYIAESYAAERNQVAADSVYALVVRRYPASPRAATALYKRALLMRAAGRASQARTALEQVVRDYPQSDEATLAREQLRTLGR